LFHSARRPLCVAGTKIQLRYPLCCEAQHVHTHTHTHIRKHTRSHTHARTHTHAHSHARTNTHTHSHTHTHTTRVSGSSLLRLLPPMRAAARCRDHCAMDARAALSSMWPSVQNFSFCREPQDHQESAAYFGTHSFIPAMQQASGYQHRITNSEYVALFLVQTGRQCCCMTSDEKSLQH